VKISEYGLTSPST